MLEFTVRGIGAWGPGFGTWPELLDGVRTGRWVEEAPLKPERIPPRERRRSPRFVKMAVEVMSQACAAADIDPADLAVVFSTAMSDMRTNDYMCRVLVDTPGAVSPTRFHNSVNNAATGYWSIATGSHAASNALCAFRYSAGMGLLEAVTQAEAEQRPVLLVVQDETTPPPLEHICASTADLALAVLLDPAGSSTSGLARWRLDTAVGAATRPGLPAALQGRLVGNPGADLLPFILAHGPTERAETPLTIALNSNLHARLEKTGREGATA